MSRRPRSSKYIQRLPSGPKRSSKSSSSARTLAAGRFVGEEAELGRRLGAGRLEDVARVGEDAVAPDEDRRGGAAAGAAHGEAMEYLQVGALDVGDAGPVERPAGLLAEVADRDRDQHVVG